MSDGGYMIPAEADIDLNMLQTVIDAATARDIKKRTPLHMQTGRRLQVFVYGGKVLKPATKEEMAALRLYEESRAG